MKLNTHTYWSFIAFILICWFNNAYKYQNYKSVSLCQIAGFNSEFIQNLQHLGTLEMKNNASF